MDKTIDRWKDPDGNGYAFKDEVARAQNRATIDKMNAETADRKAEVNTERKRIDNLIATGTAQTQEIGKTIIQDSDISSGGIVLKGLTHNNYYYKLFEESGSIDSEFCIITNQQGKYTAKLLKPGLYYMNFKVHVEMSGGFSEEVIASLKLFKSNTLDWSTFDVLDAETVEISKTENTSINKKIHFLFRVAEPSYIRIYIDIDTSHTKTITFRIDGCDIIALDWKGKQSANLSELHDLRIGADGVVHNTAGEAVRKQIGNLTEDIIDCLKGTEIEVNNKTDKPFTDFNDVKTNSVYSVAVKDLSNMPVQAIGVLITIGYKPDSDFGCTQWYIVNGDVYVRLLNGTWGVWEKLYNSKNKDSDFVSNFNYMFPNAFDTKVSSAGIFKGRINTVKPSDNFDFDELKESVCVYNEDKNANGLPENDFGTMICFANKGNQTYGVFQVYSTYYTHRTYIRYRTGTWNEWKEIVTKDYFDNNFDAFPFTCFGVIGDSLASGCSNYQNSQGAWKGKDIPKFSWGKYIERKYGVECTLFTKGGTTTRSWLNGEWGKSLLESSEPLEMYYIGLGNNDYYSLGASYLGSASDIHIGNEEQNADTYYGNYSKIIATIKSKSPRAKIFCFTEPNKNKDSVCHLFNEAVRNIIEMYDNVFLFDLEYNEKYMTNGIFKTFEYGSHYVSPAYKLMAEFIYKMTSDYILNNPNDFMDIQWITENHD